MINENFVSRVVKLVELKLFKPIKQAEYTPQTSDSYWRHKFVRERNPNATSLGRGLAGIAKVVKNKLGFGEKPKVPGFSKTHKVPEPFEDWDNVRRYSSGNPAYPNTKPIVPDTDRPSRPPLRYRRPEGE